MATNETKLLTENPLLDEIVWNAKMLARGVVLKDTDEANKYESLESIQNGDMLIAINENNVKFNAFVYTEDLLSKVSNISNENIVLWASNNNLIPKEIQPFLLNLAKNEFTTNYVEKNDYYRMMHGDPYYDPTGEWQGIWIDVNTITETNKYPAMRTTYINTPGTDYQLIHKLSIGYIELLYEIGVIDTFFSNSSYTSLGLDKNEVLYLKHLGSHSVDYYTSRKAARFEMLYCPTADSIEVETRFKELLEANRRTTLYTVYSEAYKFQSDYYDRFMMILIVIQTVVDMIVELPEYIIRRDVFDARTCQYIFESNGVEYFEEIPIKYQVALIKNLNKLIKFKSTDRCLVDICSIFGFKSIELFKYYILKDRKVMSQTDLRYYNIKNGDGEFDIEKNYDIQFVKVPILGNYDDYIRTGKNIYNYDTITNGDDYWIGDKERKEILEEIKEMDFTLLRSKYYSIEAMVDLTERTFQLVYFMNILLYNEVDKSKLLVNLPNVSTKKSFEVVDTIITLYALSYIYYDAEDDIMNTQGKILKILGFNFEANLTTIGEHLYETYGKSLSDLKIDGFVIPDGQKILTYNQLETIYTTNKNIYDHVMYELTHPLRKETYDAYMYIYKSLFIMNLNMEYFKLPNGDMAETYTEFLSYKDPLLAAFLIDIKSTQPMDKRQIACVDAIQSITTYLKDYVDSDVINLDNVFAGLPSISLDFIKQYIAKVIEFFKSFKIFTHDMSLTYLFQDKFQNTITMIDWMLLKYIFDKSEVIKLEDLINKSYISMEKDEKAELIDKIWMYIDTWVNKNLGDYYNQANYPDLSVVIRDFVASHYATFDTHDTDFEERINDEIYRMLVTMVLSTKVDIDDKMISKIFTMDKDEFFSDQIQDFIHDMLVNVEYHQGMRSKDKMITFSSFMELYTRKFAPSEFIASNKVQLQLNDDDKYDITDNYYLIITNEES